MFDGSITISPDISVSFIGSIPVIVGWYTVNIQLGCPFESHIISRNQALLDISLKFNPHVWCLETCFLSKSHRLSRRLHQNPNPTRYVFPYVPWCSYIFQRFLYSIWCPDMSWSCSNILMFSNHVFLNHHILLVVSPSPTSPKLSLARPPRPPAVP